jgi:raffinose/stachyose/melibiose transport system permease protein
MTAQTRRVGWLLAIPGILALVAFHYLPVAAGAFYSFTDWNGVGSPDWVGFGNYRQIFQNEATRGALWHTLLLGGALFVGANTLGLALALGLNRALKTRHFLRALFFLPAVLSPIATSYVWQYILDPNGVFNKTLGTLGLSSLERPWLGDPTWALWGVVLVLIWQSSGITMAIYLAGLQSIPDELVEAANIDGASTWMRFRRITLPLLLPAFTVAGTITLIYGLRTFDQILALTGGGPVDATETLASQMWEEAFAQGKYGYGAALALVLTGLIALFAIGQVLALRRMEVSDR